MVSTVCRRCSASPLAGDLYLLNSGSCICAQHSSECLPGEYQFCNLAADPVIQYLSTITRSVGELQTAQVSVISLEPLLATLPGAVQARTEELFRLSRESYQQVDWQCLACGHVNASSNKICWKCREPQGSREIRNPVIDPPDPSFLLETSENGYWTCPKCRNGRYYPTSQKVCECSYVNINICDYDMEEPEAAVPDTSSVSYAPIDPSIVPWTCRFCRYEYNLKYHQTCQKCGKEKEVEEVKVSPPQYWFCNSCKFAGNLSEFEFCKHCHAQREKKDIRSPAPAPPPAVYCPQCSSWFSTEAIDNGLCQECIAQNRATEALKPTCEKCQSMHEGRCPSTQLCSKCNNAEVVTGSLCRQCSKSEPSQPQVSESPYQGSETPPPGSGAKQRYCLHCRMIVYRCEHYPNS